jgi:hypothetical protein
MAGPRSSGGITCRGSRPYVISDTPILARVQAPSTISMMAGERPREGDTSHQVTVRRLPSRCAGRVNQFG